MCTAPVALWVFSQNLNRAGLNSWRSANRSFVQSLKEALDKWDIVSGHVSEEVKTFYKAGPAGIPTQTAFSQSTRWPSLDADREQWLYSQSGKCL